MQINDIVGWLGLVLSVGGGKNPKYVPFAQLDNMFSFQTASSYVMRLRLGGKSYAPDPKSALAPYVKGISEFTQLVNKLQTIVEEEAKTQCV